MNQRKKTTEWPKGFEADIRSREFTDIKDLMHEKRPHQTRRSLCF